MSLARRAAQRANSAKRENPGRDRLAEEEYYVESIKPAQGALLVVRDAPNTPKRII